jgi:hypothetical protein
MTPGLAKARALSLGSQGRRRSIVTDVKFIVSPSLPSITSGWHRALGAASRFKEVSLYELGYAL